MEWKNINKQLLTSSGRWLAPSSPWIAVLLTRKCLVFVLSAALLSYSEGQAVESLKEQQSSCSQTGGQHAAEKHLHHHG